MRVRRLIATSAAVLTAASGAACSATTNGAAASPASRPAASIPADPVLALAAAKGKLGTESARFSQDSSDEYLRFTGMVNAETKNWELTGAGFVIRRVGKDLYMQASGKMLNSMLLPPAT